MNDEPKLAWDDEPAPAAPSGGGIPAGAIDFLTALFPEGALLGNLTINFRGLLHGQSPETACSYFAPSVTELALNGAGDQLGKWNADDRSVYIAPGIRRGREGTKGGVAGLAAFWVDLDAKTVLNKKTLTTEEREEGKRRARRWLDERLPPALRPSIVVDTGGGLQAWWLLKEPAWIGDDDYTIVTLEGYLKGLARHLGGDPAVTHVAALMRLPGFINRKYADAPVAKTLIFEPDRRFNPSDFTEYFQDVPQAAAAPRQDQDPDAPLGQLTPCLETCAFLQSCRDHPAEVSEPRWDAMVSNQGRVEGGREEAHAFSRGYPRYSARETDAKLDQALRASGPHTCAKIQELGFTGCPAGGHGVRSPAGLGWPKAISRAEHSDTDHPAPDWPLYDAADDWTFPEPAFIVAQLILERGVTWIGGAPKRYKSLLIYYICLAIACGRDLVAEKFRIHSHPKILYIAREDHGGRLNVRKKDTLTPWGLRPRPGALKVLIRPRFDLLNASHVAWLRDTCRLHGITVIVVDTWTALSPSADPLGAKEQTTLAAIVSQLAEDIAGAVVVIDHTRKNRPEGLALSSAEILGPSQKWQAAEHVVMVETTADRHRLEVFVEGKDAETERFFLAVSLEGSGTEKFTYAGTIEAIADAQRAVGDHNRDAVHRILVDAGKPLSIPEVYAAAHARQLDLASGTISNHLRALAQDRRATVSGKGKATRYLGIADAPSYAIGMRDSELFDGART